MLNRRSLSVASAALLAMALPSGQALAGETVWKIEPENSSIAFGSIKNDAVGETHHFNGVSGTVDAAGQVTVDIDLASVETYIDIRNERMNEFVFSNIPKATLSAEVEMDDLAALDVGASTTTDAFGTLSLLGREIDVDAVLFVMRLSEDKVMVTTDGMAMLNVADAGLSAGIDKLQEIAELDSITRVSPITMRLFLTSSDEGES
ncbi:MAG: YceI family protein [Pseudomonadota bacterium]